MNEASEQMGEETTEVATQVEQVQSDSQPSERTKGSVPLEALQAERAQRQSLQEELRVIKDHIALMQSQQAMQSNAKQEEMNTLSDDDVLTVGEAKKFLHKMNQQHQMSIQELKIAQKHPDYADVVTKYLPEVLNQNPSLRKTLQDSQDFELAYYLAKNSDGYKSDTKKTKRNADAERIVQNAQSTGSLSSIGSTSPINQARRYKDMSDDEFQATVNRNMGVY